MGTVPGIDHSGFHMLCQYFMGTAGTVAHHNNIRHQTIQGQRGILERLAFHHAAAAGIDVHHIGSQIFSRKFKRRTGSGTVLIK